MGRKNQHEWGYVGFTTRPVGHYAPDVLFCGLCGRYKSDWGLEVMSLKALKIKYPNFRYQDGWGG